MKTLNECINHYCDEAYFIYNPVRELERNIITTIFKNCCEEFVDHLELEVWSSVSLTIGFIHYNMFDVVDGAVREL